MSGPSEFGRIAHLVMKHPRDAFVNDAAITAQWQALNYAAPPDLARACEEYERLLDLIRSTGAEVTFLPKDAATGLDSIYVRDASVVSNRGLIACNMGKPARAGEPAAQAAMFSQLGLPVAGAIEAPGQLEGGDLIWLDARTVAIGQGYRTNGEGIRQFRELVGDTVDELLTVPLPHWHGAGEVLHLMSLISPVDHDLAVVYSPLLPVPFRQRLLERGCTLVEVPDEEFGTMGANVLALAPRQCVMISGNPVTRRRLEQAGAEVFEYDGLEISVKGAGGPTCLTRPLERDYRSG